VETILDLLATAPGLWAFGLLVACGLGLPPWSEEIVILGSGYFIAEGDLTYLEALLACTAGIWGGDSIIYGLGRFAGDGVEQWPVLRRHMQPMKRHRFNKFFLKHGTKAVFFARFLPGFRMLAYFVAGNLRLKFWKFIVLDSIGVAISVPISIWLGWKLADNLDQATALMHKFQLPIAGVLLIAFGLFLRNRRLKRIKRLNRLREMRAQRQKAAKDAGSEGQKPAGRPEIK